MAIGVEEVDASPATAVVDLHLVETARSAAIRHVFRLNPGEDLVELRISHT